MKHKKAIYIASPIVLIIAVLIWMNTGKSGGNSMLKAEVERGEFSVIVTTTGELQAKNSEKIMGPKELGSRSLRFREIQIKNLVPEGTMVDSGDFVAELDRGEAANMLKDVDDEVMKIESQLMKMKLDTTMKMRDLRDQLINLKFELEEKQLVVDQSMYEPPATQRQAKINLEKTRRSYEQAEKNYALKEQQSFADMKEIMINLSKKERKKADMLDVLSRFTVLAPKKGMVIYTKEWGGQKRKVGSNISPWDLVVATLPDLSKMVSKTYVNEIDISKIKKGQKVKVGVDAFPEKEYEGIVTQVANIGEQLPNADAKVFEVIIELNETDMILRPAMTTSNAVLIEAFEEVNYIPLEALHANDSLSYVYTAKGRKQVVVLGASNENQVVVKQGLEKGQKVLLNVPEDAEDWNYAGLELLEENVKTSEIAKN